MEEFETNGVWWLPGKENKKVKGILEFNPIEGGKLKLLGTFENSMRGMLEDFGKLELKKHTIILGINSKGEKITLYNCFQKHRQISSTLSHVIYGAKIVIKGHHFTSKEEIGFDSFKINYSQLSEWVGNTGFKKEILFDEDKNFKKHIVTYEFPEKDKANLDDFTVSLNYSFSDKGDDSKKVVLEQQVFIEISSNKNLNIEEFFREVNRPLYRFLSLAIGKRVYPLSITGKNSSIKFSDNHLENKYEKNFDIYYQIIDFPDEIENVSREKMLFNFYDIKDDLEKYLMNWFEKSKLIQPLYRLYFNLIRESKIGLENQFLNLVQGLEAYHRKMFNDNYIPDEEYENLYNKFIEVIPEDLNSNFKNSLNSKLKLLNQYSLKKRLKEVYRKYEELMSIVIDDYSNLIQKVVETRHYLTHYVEDLKNEAATDKELFRLIEKLSFMIEICLLGEIGFPKEKIKNLINEGTRYNLLRRRD